ncbi:hypothetical protein M0802_016878 [Mischocyttarus mexicanus]|nr:hypothetical protein M0802_016878 [Mischocyttarus mexicanus]
MIKYAATNTTIRKEKILEGFKALKMNDYPTLQKEFKFSINPQFEEVEARVLNPPMLSYDREEVQVRKGVWRAKKMVYAVELKPNEWGIFNFHPGYIKSQDINRFLDELGRSSFTYGMSISKLHVYRECDSSRKGTIISYFDEAKQLNLKLVLVIIPDINEVTASCDKFGFKYAIELRLQPPRQEIISDLAEIIRKLFITFRTKTGQFPRQVIVYRDGVSDGQLVHVLGHELPAFKQAFKMLNISNNIPVTFLVVQKRHHIRFFPNKDYLSDDKNFNVQAGTIVDTQITHPSHIDFYLVSHASIQGTARPTKYKCVYNEINMTEDQIEELTYYLCHMFARCTRSVSYPAPTYYAHLAAFRARALIQNVAISLERLSEEQKKVDVIMKDKSPMFFV